MGRAIGYCYSKLCLNVIPNEDIRRTYVLQTRPKSLVSNGTNLPWQRGVTATDIPVAISSLDSHGVSLLKLQTKDKG